MIAPLRRTHRRTFAALALLLPVVLIAGLAARRPQPAHVAAQVAAADLVSAGGAFVVRLQTEARVRVELRALHPDPLLYLSAMPPADTLPYDAQLLGPAGSPRGYRLPPGDAYLILYSGGHRRVVDFARLEAEP